MSLRTLLGKLLLLTLAACANRAWAAAEIPASHVFLVQNSGWMEPFFTDPASPYKALITELAIAVTQENDLMVLAAFNQSLPGAPSPKALDAFKVQGKTQRARIAAAMATLKLAKKPSGALADTDLTEAVSVSMDTALARKPGLVWLFTNNKNSPNNDQATNARNREFYALIHQGAQIKKALAFPLQMPVRGKVYAANGLMVYVFAIEEQGVAQLDRLLATGRLQKIITEPPARLKPLDQDSVRLTPVMVGDSPGVVFSIKPDHRLQAQVLPDANTPSAKVQWRLENTIYPYAIASARISARSVLAKEDKPVQLASDSIQGLEPGQSILVSSRMQLPLAQIPGKWSARAIGTAGSAFVLPGVIALELHDQRLVLSSAFKQRMAALFPGDPLPDIFTPPDKIQAVHAELPIDVRVVFGLAPLLLLIGGVLALLGLSAGALLLLNSGRKVQITVEGETRTLHNRIGGTLPIFDKDGIKLAALKTTLFGNQLIDLREGAQVRLGR